VAQYGGTLLSRPDSESAPAWRIPRFGRTHHAIGTYIDRHNESPKPFIWTARAADILEKVKRARRTLNKRRSV
jgi:hypothetical protein